MSCCSTPNHNMQPFSTASQAHRPILEASESERVRLLAQLKSPRPPPGDSCDSSLGQQQQRMDHAWTWTCWDSRLLVAASPIRCRTAPAHTH